MNRDLDVQPLSLQPAKVVFEIYGIGLENNSLITANHINMLESVYKKKENKSNCKKAGGNMNLFVRYVRYW